MPTEVKLPRLGQGMESGVIVRWLRAEGDAISKGDPLYELDTDKVTQEVESDVTGTLVKIVVAEGEVEVGATVAVIDAGADSPDGESARVPRRRRPRLPSLRLRPWNRPPSRIHRPVLLAFTRP